MRALPMVAATALLIASPCRAEPTPADPWWGPDKALHFGVSAALAGGFYAVGATFLDERWERAAFGAGVALSLGLGKELADAAGAGTPSLRDFTWDVLGAGAGLGLAVGVDAATRPREAAPTTTSRAEGRVRVELLPTRGGVGTRWTWTF